MIVRENYNERLEKGTYYDINTLERDRIINYFKNNHSLSAQALSKSDEFYSVLRRNLANKNEVNLDLDAILYLDCIGLSTINLNDYIFILWELPDQITKLKIRELHRQWEEIWCPPADDGLVILIPYKKCFLITDYDSVYYD